MDTSVKALINIWLVFLGMVLLLSCLSFFIAYNNATSLLYSVIQDIEIYGYDKKKIESIETGSDVSIMVNPIATQVGQQFEVKVGFYHIFAFVKKEDMFFVSSLTRIFDY